MIIITRYNPIIGFIFTIITILRVVGKKGGLYHNIRELAENGMYSENHKFRHLRKIRLYVEYDDYTQHPAIGSVTIWNNNLALK